MKEVNKKVYYCDFCKTHKLTKQSMRLHEEHCTLNPNRDCRLCRGEDVGIKFDIEEKVDHTPTGEISWTTREIKITGKECPVCVLSFARLNNITNILDTSSEYNGFWNYKEASEKFLNQRNIDDKENGFY